MTSRLTNEKLWSRIGAWGFVLGWVLIIAYATSPLWQGQSLKQEPNATTAGILIADLPNGAEFAAHQGNKPGAGSTPRVIPIKVMPEKPFLVVLTWGYTSYEVDTRWSPGLLQHDGQRFLYAQGEQTPSRSGKASGKRVPTTHVMKVPWKGDLNERVYALTPGTKYFLFLPQATSKSTKPYSVELRNRQTGAAQPTYLLLLGLVTLVGGLLILVKHSRSTHANLDTVEAARVYVRWRRFAQARQILQEGLRKQPSRQAEFELVLREIEHMETVDEPGRVSVLNAQWPKKVVVVLMTLTIAYMAYTMWNSFRSSPSQSPDSKQRVQEKQPKQLAEKMLPNFPKDAAAFNLQDSQWAFVALGRGTVQANTVSLTVNHDAMRVMQLADCPSDACRPIRSMQWLLVVPQHAAESNGAWTAVAKSRIQTIDFHPTERNAQHVVNAGQMPLKIEREFDTHQASLMLQLTAEGGITTYSRSQLLWPVATEPIDSLQNAASSSKGQQSLHAALYYADAAATREHLKAGASVRERYENDSSVTHIAAFSGCVECLDALKNAGADLNDKVSSFRHETPLMMAIRNKQVTAARKLIELGANPCITDRDGYDAMGWVKFYKFEPLFPFISACRK